MMRLTMVCVLACGLVSSLRADDVATTSKLPVATIDIAYIFKNYKPVQEKTAPLRAAVQELEKTVQLRQVEIEQLQRRLQSPKEGDDRGRLQVQIAKLQTELRVYVETERQDLQKRELKIQAEVYRTIQDEVRKLAKARDLKLVVVRPRGDLESEDFAELQRTLNQLVIFEEGLDITDDVLKALESRDEQQSR
jgi:Skp family chaperone for outer membrane proteins